MIRNGHTLYIEEKLVEYGIRTLNDWDKPIDIFRRSSQVLIDCEMSRNFILERKTRQNIVILDLIKDNK